MRHIPVILLLLSAISVIPAVAGPREDSLAGVSRCAALPDDRTFLDCVYGAMQPMRTQLGLVPAPIAQQRLVPPAYQAPPRYAPPPSAQAAMPPAPPRAPSASSNGGLLDNVFEGSSGLHMASYSFDKRGLFTVTLSDGTVWKQDGKDTNFAHFAGKASQYPVSLHPTDTGKARMDVRGEDGTFLVERVR